MSQIDQEICKHPNSSLTTKVRAGVVTVTYCSDCEEIVYEANEIFNTNLKNTEAMKRAYLERKILEAAN